MRSSDPGPLSTAVDIADAVRRREISPIETVETALARMDAVEPQLHAFSTPAPDQARAAAAALEAALARGAPAGPLAGVPVAVKDVIATKGVAPNARKTTLRRWTCNVAGNPSLSSSSPSETETGMRSVALVVGSTVTT